MPSAMAAGLVVLGGRAAGAAAIFNIFGLCDDALISNLAMFALTDAESSLMLAKATRCSSMNCT